MLKEKYTITTHSFVDLITNSSTELYIEATAKTVETIKQLINNLLFIGKSEMTCDELFTIEIDKERFKKDYGWDEERGNYDEYIKEDYHENGKNVYLLVKCRDENSVIGKETAKILSNLTDMFSIDARENR